MATIEISKENVGPNMPAAPVFTAQDIKNDIMNSHPIYRQLQQHAPKIISDVVDKQIQEMKEDVPNLFADVVDMASNLDAPSAIMQKDAPKVEDPIAILNDLDARIAFDSMQPINGKVSTLTSSLNDDWLHHYIFIIDLHALNFYFYYTCYLGIIR
jgi:hypothetical protein